MMWQKKPGQRDISKAFHCVAVLSVFFAVGIAVLLNLFVNRLPSFLTAVDLSAEGLYSLGEETDAVLSSLDSEIRIYWLVESGNENKQIEYLLKRYQERSPYIITEKVDPVLYPEFARQYTDSTVHDNSLLVVRGDRGRLLDHYDLFTADYGAYGDAQVDTVFHGEEQLTSAIYTLMKGYSSIIYGISGHGESELGDPVKKVLSGDNYQLKQLVLLKAKEIPQDADAVLLMDPEKDLTAAEGEILDDYLKRGGRLLAFISFHDSEMPVLDEILGSFGMKRSKGIVFEGDSGRYYGSYQMYLLPEIKTHEITAPLLKGNYSVLAPNSEGLIPSAEASPDLKLDILLESSQDSYSKSAGYESRTIDREMGDPGGPFVIAAAAEKKTAAETTRAVWVASERFTDGDVDEAVSGSNTVLIENAAAWLTNREVSLNIRSKYLTSGKLALSSRDKTLYSVILLGVIPGLFAVCGFAIYLWRRRR